MKKTSSMCIAFFLMLAAFNLKGQVKVKPAYNVLFIFVDDLRPELGCYGDNYIHSPNLDQLASTATVFKKQFVTVPTCGASRASILTGMLPRNPNDLSNE